MKLHVGKIETAGTLQKEWTKVLKEGSWVLEKDTKNFGYQGIGRFDPVKIEESNLADILMCLNAENLGYSYKIEKHNDKYYVI